MYLQVHKPSHHDQPSIAVGGEDVSLTLYWRTVDLWLAGHTNDSIVDHIVATSTSFSVDALRDIVRNIIWNQELIHQEPFLTPSSSVVSANAGADTRRNSRILDVEELDDLDVAQKVADKKQRASLRDLLHKLV